MCRWIAYRGETVALEHYVTAPAHSLIEQSMRAVEALSGINGDGFGDVLIGDFAYDNGEVNEGRVYVYHGSAAGRQRNARGAGWRVIRGGSRQRSCRR